MNQSFICVYKFSITRQQEKRREERNPGGRKGNMRREEITGRHKKGTGDKKRRVESRGKQEGRTKGEKRGHKRGEETRENIGQDRAGNQDRGKEMRREETGELRKQEERKGNKETMRGEKERTGPINGPKNFIFTLTDINNQCKTTKEEGNIQLDDVNVLNLH